MAFKAASWSFASSAAALCLLASASARAGGLPSVDFDVLADLRLHTASGEQGWLDGGLGKGRYGGTAEGGDATRLTLAELSLLANMDITWDLHAFVHAKFDPEQDKPADLVEAYLRYRPVPKSAIAYELKAGLFFPHISREHTDVAWTSPYTITPSAINTWVGEEIRALGLEAKAIYRADDHKVSLTAAVFGFNDPAGTLLAFRGWSLSDAKVGAFSQLPLAPLTSIGPGSPFLRFQPEWVHPIREVDNRPGFYGALDWEYGDNLAAGVFYYDNRGDPEAFKYQQYGWDTRFWNVYIEATPFWDIDLIGQYMTGETLMGFLKDGVHRAVDVNYSSYFLLASRKFGASRLSVRYDWFKTRDDSFVVEDNNNEYGKAWTFAFAHDIGKRDRLMVEFLRVNSDRYSRWDLGLAPEQAQTILQVSFRKRI